MPDSIPKDSLRININRNCWQTRTITDTKSKEELNLSVKLNDWNKVHIKVKDNNMQHYINGVLFSEVTDLDSINRNLKGFIGVQVHVGPPMKIEYRNIQLKHL